MRYSAACAAMPTTALAPATNPGLMSQIAMDKTRVSQNTRSAAWCVTGCFRFPRRGPSTSTRVQQYRGMVRSRSRPRCGRAKISRSITWFAENADSRNTSPMSSEQNLLPDTSGEPVRHPQVARRWFGDRNEKGSYRRGNPSLNRAFSKGKVDSGFPFENATTQESLSITGYARLMRRQALRGACPLSAPKISIQSPESEKRARTR